MSIHLIDFVMGFTWGLGILALLKYIFVKPVKIYIGADTPVRQETPSKPLIKPKEPKETEEQRKQKILDENVDNYMGNGKGQVKI